MARPTPTTHNSAPDDELDDILNGNADIDDIFNTSNIRAQSIAPAPQAQRNTDSRTANLGIDEEIKVTKARKPAPKLDEARLLSAQGIPRLQRISKERLKFKGKGHEYGDIARMLNMYQLWLDDLYPRAKFADGLAMIEALGHKKHVQFMRKEWIDAGKPKIFSDSDPEDEDTALPVRTTETNTDAMEGIQPGTVVEEQGLPEETPAESIRPATAPAQEDEDEYPDDDDLDELLAEAAAPSVPTTAAVPPPKTTTAEEDMFADEMEAMAEMEDMW